MDDESVRTLIEFEKILVTTTRRTPIENGLNLLESLSKNE